MKQTVTSWCLFPLLTIAILALTILQPLSTHAETGDHLHWFGTRGRPYASARGNLIYHNGPVMPGVMRAYVTFWEPAGSYVSSRYNSLILRYFRDIGSSALYHNITQYKDAQGESARRVVLADSWVDTRGYAGQTISDTQIQQEVMHAMGTKGWQANMSSAFFVFTSKGENICIKGACSFQQFCGYHSSFNGNILYLALPYTATNLAACAVPSSPNGDLDAESTISITSHEQMEAATDPLLSGWFDAQGSEIGDKCAWQFGRPVTLNGHSYMLQKEWDNAKHGCVLAGP